MTRPVPVLTTDVVLLGHTAPVTSVVFRPDGRSLATSGDVTIRLWDPTSRQPSTVLTAEDMTATALSPDGHTMAVACGVDHPVSLWTIETGRITTLTGSAGRLESLAFSPDGRTLASSEDQPLSDRSPFTGKTVRLWDPTTGQNTVALSRPVGYGHALAFHPDGQTLAGCAGLDGTGQLLNLATGHATVLTGHSAGIETAAFSPDGRTLATGSVDGTVRLWDPATGRTITTLTPHSGYVVAVSFSPDSRTLASAGIDNTVRLWDPATGQNTATLMGHADFVASVAFSPDGATLASGSHDGTVRLWTVR